MHAVFVDGRVTFDTNHFSTYIIKYELSVGSIAAIVVACVVVALIAAFAIVWFIVLRHGFKDLKNICKKESWTKKTQPQKTAVEEKAEVVARAEAKISAQKPTKAKTNKSKPVRVMGRKK